MTYLQRRPSAQILPFRRPRALGTCLTVVDRIEALRWQDSAAGPSGTRLAIYHVDGEDTAETGHYSGDYISIYRGDDEWAAWGAARSGDRISVWRSATGVDLGHFPTMREALAAVRSGFSRLQS